MSIAGFSISRANVANVNTTFGDVTYSAAAEGSLILGFEAPTGIAGSRNTFYGYQAATSISQGSCNVAIGFRAAAGSSSTTSSAEGIVAIGAYAAESAWLSVANTCIGSRAGQANIAGSSNTCIGSSANAATVAGSMNCAVGAGSTAGQNNDCNVAMGSMTAAAGGGCVAIGATSAVMSRASILVGAGGASAIDSGAPNSVVLSTAPIRASNAETLYLNGRIVGSLLSNTIEYGMHLNADRVDVAHHLAVDSCNVSAIDAGIMLRSSNSNANHWWRLAMRSNANGTSADLEIRSANSNSTVFTGEFCPDLFNFTAKHRCIMKMPAILNEHRRHQMSSDVDDVAHRPPDVEDETSARERLLVGRVVASTGVYHNLDGLETPTIDEALPVVELCCRAKDPRIFGVIAGFEDDGVPHRVFRLGTMRFRVAKTDVDGVRQKTVIVNSLGEGGIWVCDQGGPILNGDLLTTSSRDGFAMRQGDDDVVRSYTVAKATCDCAFGDGGCRVRFIGCVYK